MYFTLLFYFQLSGSPFFIIVKKTDSAFSRMEQKFFKLLKKV